MKDSPKKEKPAKPKIEISRRPGAGKKKPDLFAKFRNTEHPLDDIFPDQQKNDSLASNTSNTSITALPSTSSNASNPSNTSKGDFLQSVGNVSPTRDFQKVPNSVTRQMIPQGIFRGKSKQVWDYLWSVSRGAITPSRFVRKSRPEIKVGSGLGSFVTVDASIKHLEAVGLLRKVELSGSHEGNKFEIFTPEEISPSSNTSNTSNSSYTQKMVILALPENGKASEAQTPENIGDPDVLRHSFKTNRNDDEIALDELVQTFADLSRELTGQTLKTSEKGKWRAFAELIALEIKIAARRTSSISSLPAFAAEHFRRRLLSEPRIGEWKNRRESKSTPWWAQTGKSDFNEATGEYQIKLLDEKGRKEALAMLREMKEIEVDIDEFEKWYTAEDWEWLTEKLR